MEKRKKSLADRPPLLSDMAEESPSERKKSLTLPKMSVMEQPPLLGNVKTPQDEEKIWIKVRATIARFMSNTTSHGLPRIPRARNLFGSLFWLIVWFLAALVFLITALLLYHRYQNQAPSTQVTVRSPNYSRGAKV